jgi:GH15 family glucan-1,4-alpha-glucosidase
MKLEDYGIIGDMHTAALVGRDGSIDWFCVPRFDSDSCFAALLGSEENGCWKINPADPGWDSQFRYRGDTLLLESEFHTPSGAVRLTDFMPVPGKDRRIVRVVEGLSGRVKMAMKLIIRFDHGERVPWVRRDGDQVRAVAGPHALQLSSDVPVRGEGLATVAEFELRAGERSYFELIWYRSHEAPPAPGDAFSLLAATEEFWQDWSGRCDYAGEHRAAVLRSVLTLKALTFQPTGAIVAAPTMSLPERLGGVRNWDYRFCWLRDATLTLYALLESGYHEEASEWIEWLMRAAAGDAAQLQIMYGIGGERILTELEVGHLAGYENSRPVRKGNAASEQFQLDVFGEVMDAILQARRMKIPLGDDPWPFQRHLVEFVAENWIRPDEGIWEIRGPRRHFTHSKIMAWVAVDRAIQTAEQFGLEGEIEEWRKLRDEMHANVCAYGYDRRRGVFTQSYGSTNLDASLLTMPLVGFLPATDPRVIRTVEAIQTELMVDGLVLRYHPAESAAVDGLPPGEGAFLPCSFWLVDCLCLLGRRGEAEALFRRLLALRSPLGLLAEEYDPRARRQLGNYPQAFSLVGLVNSAHNLTQSLGPMGKRLADRGAPEAAAVSFK